MGCLVSEQGEPAGDLVAAVEERVRNAESVAAHRRALVVRMHLRKREPKDIADAVGLSASRVRGILAQWGRSGLGMLRERPRGGRHHAYLTTREEAALLEPLKQKAETGGVLVVDEVKRALEDRLGVPVAEKTVYDLLARHGWRKIKPRPRHVQADVAAQEAFKAHVFPASVADAAKTAQEKGVRLRIMFMDEGRFGLLPDPRACWAPPGVRPVVSVQIVREYTYAFTAVSPQDGVMESLLLPTVNTELMAFFLEFVAQAHPGDYVLMVLDGAGWHGANDLTVPPNMRLLALPPYSPELNPTEQVWDEVREKRFANRVYTGLPAVEDDLCEELALLQRDPARVASLTGYDWVRRALPTEPRPVSV